MKSVKLGEILGPDKHASLAVLQNTQVVQILVHLATRNFNNIGEGVMNTVHVQVSECMTHIFLKPNCVVSTLLRAVCTVKALL
jgi:hypothetical protein